jgi:hypothetical protein
MPRPATKPCGDKNCKHVGQMLPLSHFPKNRNRQDGHCLYCRECILRRVHESRARKREAKLARKEARALLPEVPRKPNITSAERVRQAIERGAKTREAIQRVTHLDYDSLGDLLVEMIWESKVIRIERLPQNKREFRLAA